MELKRLRRTWEELARRDAFWAVLTQAEHKDHKWNPEQFFQTGADEIVALMAELERLHLSVRHGDALDFGCGVGRLSQALADHFERVTGVDIAPTMLDLALQHNAHGDKCRFVLNDSDNLQVLASNSFDLVYSRLVLQHMPPAVSAAYLPELVRVLRPGGVLVFQLPSDQEPPVSGGWLKRRVPLSMVRTYRRLRQRLRTVPRMEENGIARDTVVGLLERSGGTVTHVASDRGHGAATEGFKYFVVKSGGR
jgi:SAM-dependent methyltransferase